MLEQLHEYCSSRGLSIPIDRAAAVIRGVKLLGLTSKNGREYPAAVLERARALYEAAKVNVNHPKGHPSAPRDYQDRIGVIRSVEVRSGEGLFGDLHYNPKHVLAEQLAWDAEHAPENVGFSHNVRARTTRRGDAVIVEEILSVNSVDLVADPATTSGLFENEKAPGSAGGSHRDSDIIPGQSPGLSESSATEDLAAQITLLREEVTALRAELTEHRRSTAIETTRPLAREQALVESNSRESLEDFVRSICR
jgi:hypothetical protein